MFKFGCLLLRGLMRILFRVKIVGADNVPESGGAILCANHISNWDSVFVQSYVPRHIYFMAKEELFRVPFVAFILKSIGAIPVNREGSDIAAVKRALKTIRNEDVLGIFPTGQREKSKGEGEVKAGLGLIAGKTKAPVIPVHIIGNYKIFSKIELRIGKAEVFAPCEGEKLSGEVAQRLSDEIYKKIKEL